MHAVTRQYPEANWIVALHHHVVEYPTPAKALSERIGTALINGTWFVRQAEAAQPARASCYARPSPRRLDRPLRRLLIVSAPSPVMEATDDTTAFYIHTLGVDEAGHLKLLRPQRITVAGEPSVEG